MTPNNLKERSVAPFSTHLPDAGAHKETPPFTEIDPDGYADPLQREKIVDSITEIILQMYPHLSQLTIL